MGPQMHWVYSIDFDVSPVEACWLETGGSLTRRLQALGDYSLSVVAEYSAFAHAGEMAPLGRFGAGECWIREVLMSLDGVPCVSARTLVPVSGIDSDWRDVRGLGRVPLGSLLYHPSIARTRFEYAMVEGRSPLADLSWKYGLLTGRRLARRSCFIKSDVPILVAECFLPNFWDFAALPIAGAPADRLDSAQGLGMSC